MTSRLIRIGRVAAAVAIACAVPFAAASVSTPAAAGTAPVAYTGSCPQVKHTNLDGVTTTAGGKATLESDGLVFDTTVEADAVQWKTTLSAAVPMGQVEKMSYMTRKLDDGSGNAAALPAYRIFLVDTDGANDATTLIYEPYYQISGNPPANTTQTWDVLAGKFWVSKSIAGAPSEPGGSYAGNKTWAEIKAANPSAKVVAIGVGQGTYNVKTKARFNHVIFSSKKGCADHTWTKLASSPAASQSATPSGSPTVTATATATATPTATSTPPPVAVAAAARRCR